jgi:hypothetical protein
MRTGGGTIRKVHENYQPALAFSPLRRSGTLKPELKMLPKEVFGSPTETFKRLSEY